MKWIVTNQFHKTEHTTTIKDCYTGERFNDDVLIDLGCYANNHGDKYAAKKLKEIKDALCGIADCKCGGFDVAKMVK